MKFLDLISSLFWIGVGVTFSVRAIKYGAKLSGVPGAGFFPLVAGLALVFLSIITFISALREKSGGDKIVPKEKLFPKRNSWKRVLIALLALFGYGIVLGYIGFLLTTFLFMIFLLRFIEPQKWLTVLAVAFSTPVACYAVFEFWLGIQLPKGFLGI